MPRYGYGGLDEDGAIVTIEVDDGGARLVREPARPKPAPVTVQVAAPALPAPVVTATIPPAEPPAPVVTVAIPATAPMAAGPGEERPVAAVAEAPAAAKAAVVRTAPARPYVPKRKAKLDFTFHVMIKNEEFWIGHVLEALLAVDRPVVLADTGSDDATVAICDQVVEERGARDRVTFLTYGRGLNREEIGHVRQDMVGATNTEWLFIVDGDEWWPAEALRRLMGQEIPAGYNLGYSNLVVVRFDEGPGVEPSSMGMVGGGPGAFRYAEPWSGQILMRVPGLVFSGEYPCEVPCWNADPKPYYAEKNLPKALDFHHLARSRMDAETPHRMEKRGIVAMHDVFQMPFDLGRWPNPYADRVKGR